MTAGSATRVAVLYAVAALVWGCQAGSLAVPDSPSDRELLNSERIELTFGSFGIEVLSEGADLRVSNLYSVEGDGRVCRTFAVVAYPERVDPALAEAHALILGGRSIGETFEATGWSIEKQHRYFGEISDIHTRPRVAELMALEGPANAAIHIYVFVVSRDGRTIDYATIAEIHHPDYLTLDDLEALYGDDVGAVADQREGVQPILASVLRELQQD